MESARGELERALSASADSLLVCDSAGHIVGVNDSLCTLTGYDRQDLLAKRIDDLAEPDPSGLAAGLAGGATVDLEAGVRCKDGTTKRLRLRLRPLRIDGRPHSEVRVACRRRAADRLPEDPDFVRALQGSSGMPVVCMRPDGTAVYANVAFEELTARAFSEIRGRKVWELAAPSAAAEFRRQVGVTGTFETPWPGPDGGSRRMVWTASTLAAVPPDPPLGLLIGRELPPPGESPGRLAPKRRREDESRVRELEERMGRLARELETARREHEAFTYTLAHECRAPIRVLTGLSDLLVEESGRLGSVAPVADTAQRMARAARHLNTLIESLLAYSRIERVPVRAEARAVNAAFNEVLQSLDPEIHHCLARVTVEVGRDVVLADRALLFLVLVQLVSNALKFVRPGVPPQVHLRTEPRAGIVRISVRDHGIGIAPAYHERIFGLGERLHPVEDYPGAGMGLALVSRAAERMGGRVGLESREGEGSVFWVELARAPDRP